MIEIDGSSHDGKEEFDEDRETFLKDLGLKVYRIPDSRVKHNLFTVMTELEEYIVSEFGNFSVK